MRTGLIKNVTITLWILFYLLIAAVIWFNIPPAGRSTSNPLLYIGYLQRVVGMWAFLMLADQIVVGAFLPKITEKLGGWFYKYHIIQGIITYFLLLIHPVLYFIYLSVARNTINPFYVFTDFCIKCTVPNELFVSLGRFAFWIAIAAGLAAIYRTKASFLRNYWKYFHVLNYVIFIFIFIHSKMLGKDLTNPLIGFVYFVSVASVFVTIFYKIVVLAKDNITIK
jgi:predicted ferric reductase